MAGDSKRIEQKYKDIEAVYSKLSAKQYNNKRLYSHDAILEMIADKFYMKPETINKILTRLR